MIFLILKKKNALNLRNIKKNQNLTFNYLHTLIIIKNNN